VQGEPVPFKLSLAKNSYSAMGHCHDFDRTKVAYAAWSPVSDWLLFLSDRERCFFLLDFECFNLVGFLLKPLRATVDTESACAMAYIVIRRTAPPITPKIVLICVMYIPHISSIRQQSRTVLSLRYIPNTIAAHSSRTRIGGRSYQSARRLPFRLG
jgi:hypothetical protein